MVEIFTALLGSVPLDVPFECVAFECVPFEDVPFEAEQETRPIQKGAIGGRAAD